MRLRLLRLISGTIRKRAQKLLQKRSGLEKKIQRQEQFDAKIADAAVLFEFAEEDPESLNELRSLVERLEHESKPG